MTTLTSDPIATATEGIAVPSAGPAPRTLYVLLQLLLAVLVVLVVAVLPAW